MSSHPFIDYAKLELGKTYYWFRSTHGNRDAMTPYEAPSVVYPLREGGIASCWNHERIPDGIWKFEGDKFQEVAYPERSAP